MGADPLQAGRKATYADLATVPDHLVAELVDGELVTSPRPAARHAFAATSLSHDLFGRFGRDAGGPGGWIILAEPELHLDGDVLVPDLAGWRRSRMPVLPDVAAFTLAPDWVGEVLSPSTEAFDRSEKMPRYARQGVGHLWLLDPVLRTLEVFRLAGAFWQLVATHAGNASVQAEPFEAILLDLSALWAP